MAWSVGSSLALSVLWGVVVMVWCLGGVLGGVAELGGGYICALVGSCLAPFDHRVLVVWWVLCCEFCYTYMVLHPAVRVGA